MATCTKASLISGGKCYTESQWSQKDQDVLIVYLLADIYADTGGADYTADPDTLNSDAHTLLCGMTKDQREAALIAILYSYAGSSKTPNELAAAIKCFKNATKEQLEEAKLFLICNLSNALTYLT